MFARVGVRASDLEASERFYSTVLDTLPVERSEFQLLAADDEHPVTRGLHIGFVAPSRAHVHAFWRAGVDAGYRDDGEPGPRPEYGDDYYGGFLLDPDGNSIEAVHHGEMPEDAVVDHVWLRVADAERSVAFYELVGRFAGYESRSRPDGRHAHFHPEGRGSFSTLAGTPAREAHLAFPAPDTATVGAFHAAAMEAGYRDNGAPGPRPEYSPGYYGAFVLDPDGNNIELITRTEPSPGG